MKAFASSKNPGNRAEIAQNEEIFSKFSPNGAYFAQIMPKLGRKVPKLMKYLQK